MVNDERLRCFDPSGVGNRNAGIFGLPFTVDDAAIVVLPVPWDATVSYSAGTSRGPRAIFDASFQVDLHDPVVSDAWRIGIAMDSISSEIETRNVETRAVAEEYIAALEEGRSPDEEPLRAARARVNEACTGLERWVKERSNHWLEKGKLVALLGGEHSTPFGLLQALEARGTPFSILQIDAHADLREAYEGIERSHASIMYNALTLPGVKKLVQVGLRDYCADELQVMRDSGGRVVPFFDRDLKHALYRGETWADQCERIVAALCDDVYLSFDIDGLDPKLCPNTGTPVPGGLEFEQALYLIEAVVRAGKRLVAFDINEVSPGEADEWDASVGARLLYRIANLMALSQGRAKAA